MMGIFRVSHISRPPPIRSRYPLIGGTLCKCHVPTLLLVLTLVLPATVSAQESDTLPSWNEGTARSSIIAFVERVTEEGSDDFVPEAKRIATFDNDGTLWAEQPVYFQLLYAMDRVRQQAAEHPEWESEEPFASILNGDTGKALAGGEEALLKILGATHTGLTTEQFAEASQQWLDKVRHPNTGRPYTKMVYQPMLELLDYLRTNGFKTFIVSGGGIDFLRVFSEETYGIPPEQVVGTSLKARYEIRDGKPVIVKLPEIHLVDDKEGKPVGIHQHIGRRPIFAAGNSDGDYQMLEWTTAGDGPRFGLLVHHTDNEREWAYDRDSHIGRLDRGLDDAKGHGWTIVDMKRDWKVIFPKESAD